MRNLFTLSLSLFFAGAMAIGQTEGTTAAASDFAAAYQQFSFDLYQNVEKKLTQEAEPQNVVVSPLSAWFALSMLQQGANTNTLDCINQTLRLPEGSQGLALYNSQLISDLLKPCEWTDWGEGGEKPVLELANGLWTDDLITCLDKYKDSLSICYGAECSQLDLQLQESLDEVDVWVNEKTHGTIPSLNILPSEELLMLLVNALYFKGSWEMGADEGITEDRPFYSSTGEARNVPTIYFEGPLNYGVNEEFQTVRMWFGQDHRFSMTFFLPQGDTRLTSETYNQAIQSLGVLGGASLWLPRFTIDADFYMTEALEEMGMAQVFSSGADFSRMTENPIWVSFVKQLSHIAVDEKGVEASAVTVIGAEMSIPGPKQVTIDHPFYFSLEDNLCNKVMFIGHIVTLGNGNVQGISSHETSLRTSPDVVCDLSGRRQPTQDKGLNVVRQGGNPRIVFVK